MLAHTLTIQSLLPEQDSLRMEPLSYEEALERIKVSPDTMQKLAELGVALEDFAQHLADFTRVNGIDPQLVSIRFPFSSQLSRRHKP